MNLHHGCRTSCRRWWQSHMCIMFTTMAFTLFMFSMLAIVALVLAVFVFSMLALSVILAMIAGAFTAQCIFTFFTRTC